MSKEKYKLHPISALINFIKVLKDMIVPLVFVVAVMDSVVAAFRRLVFLYNLYYLRRHFTISVS